MQTQIDEMEFGVELTKSYEEEEYHLPSVVYEFTSKRPYRVLVRVVETIPDDIDPQHIGFHEDSDTDEWKLTDDKLVFETEIPGRSEYKTVYAVYPETSCDVEQLMTPPDKFTVEQATAGSPSKTDTDTFTRSPSSPQERETERFDETTPILTLPETEEDGEPESEGDSDAAGAAGSDPNASPGDADDRTSEPSAEDEASLVDQLVAELRADDAAADSLEYLKQRFGPAATSDKSVEVRIDQLQNDVADLRSYRNAFEDFLGQHGSPEEVVERFETRLEAFDTTLESVEARVEEQEGSLTTVQTGQEEIRSDIDTINQVIWRTMQNVQELSSDVDSLDEQVSHIDVEEQIEDIEDDLDEMATVFDALQDAFQD